MAQQIQFIYLSQSDYDSLASKNNGRIYFTSDTHRIYKGSELYAATTFDELSFSDIQVSNITVDGKAVSLEGHGHSMSDIDGLDAAISAATSGFALENHTHTELSGLTSSSITKDTGTFTNLVVTGEVTMSLSNVDFQNINASSLTVNGSAVSLEGHSHSTSEITGLESMITAATSSFASADHTHNISDIRSLTAKVTGLTSSKGEKNIGIFTSLSADNATFGDINVTGTASLSTTNVTASTLTAGAGSFTTLTVGGSSVALVGHTHPASEVTGLQSVLDGLSSTYALASHSHAISDITNLSPILSGITSSSVEKDTVTADIGYFRLLSVSGSANFAVNNVSANSVTVNGTEVALSGHTHSVADIDGLSTTLQAYASASHFHSISDITNLQTTLSGFASSGHTHDELSGLTSSTIDRLSGSFNALTASTATFGSINVANSATFDITNLVADAITVSDLNLTGTLSVSSTSVSSMTVTDLSVTGTLTLNSKSIATQEYVQLMISQAIGQILASAY